MLKLKHWAMKNHFLWESVCRIRTIAMPRRQNVWLASAWFYMEKEKWDRAEAAFEKALAIAPLDCLGYASLGTVCARQDRFLEADQYFRKAIELRDSNDGNPCRELERGLNILGLRELVNGRTSDAESHFDLAGSISANQVSYYKDLWSTLINSAYFSLAYHYYQRNRCIQSALRERLNLPIGNKRYLSNLWSIQIGHLAHLDGYLKIELLGWRPPQETILLTAPESISNRFFLECWKPYLTVVTCGENIAATEEEALVCEDYLPIQEIAGIPHWAPVAAAKAQEQWDLEGRAPLLKLDAATVSRGCEALSRLGVPNGAWIVGLHVRESGFHGETDNATQRYRNGAIESYLPAIEAIVRRGGWVVRMGDSTMSRLAVMPGVVDYAHSDLRADWLDVFLCAHSRFFLGTQSGLSQVPNCFGIPTVYTNWISAAVAPWYKEDLFIPKLFRFKKTGKLLTMSEILSMRLSYLQALQILEQGIAWIDNTPQEIADVVEEMMDRLDGRAAGDDSLQQHWAVLAKMHGVVVNSRLGTRFLTKHFELFQDSDPMVEPCKTKE